MPASALLLGASVASLNLCTDEYLLLLARPAEIASVSYLARDPRETPLWRQARRHPPNRGSIEQVIARRPRAVLTMGGGGRATGLIGRRLGIRVLDLPPATTLAGVERNLRATARLLGDGRRADPLIARLRQLQRTAPARAQDAIWLSGGGLSLSPGSIGGHWLRLGGLAQRPLPGGRASLETLLTAPPQVLVISDYRRGQMSGGTRWLDHPVVRRARARQVWTDGRAWTCMGPLMIAEVEKLRAALR